MWFLEEKSSRSLPGIENVILQKQGGHDNSQGIWNSFINYFSRSYKNMTK